MLIILPSLISGIGLGFIIAGVAVDQHILRALFLSLGLLLIWINLFLTLSLIRRSLRSVDQRLRRIEELLLALPHSDR